MKEKLLYLKPNIIFEPLFASWYAWPHLISPATAAMNVVGRHLRIINSFIQAPQVHAAAVKDARMLGGPFMDHPEALLTEIKNLKEYTLKQQRHLIALAEAIRDLHLMLKREATGYCLDPFYEKVPEPLKGYVELFYDLHNQPSFRLYEALLYKSHYYQRDVQSIVAYPIHSDHRPFLLSTPRLSNKDVLELKSPFDDKGLDTLFHSRYEATPYAEICEKLRIANEQAELFRNLFTDTLPPPLEQFNDEGVRVRYFGHACLLIQTREVSILFDPVLSYRYEGGMPRYTYDDLPEVIDYIIITHNHQDHILLETLLQLRHKVKNIIVPRSGTGQLQDPSLKLMFRALGFTNVIELDELETIEIPGGEITGLPFAGEHSDLSIRTKLCHHIRLGNRSLLLVADSSSADPQLYQHVHQLMGNIDILFIGMECDGAPLTWLYGPLLPEPIPRDKDHSRRLAGSDFARAAHLVEQFYPKEVYVYAMGQEPWLNYVMAMKYTKISNPIVQSNKLLAFCKEKGIVVECLFGMKEMRYL